MIGEEKGYRREEERRGEERRTEKNIREYNIVSEKRRAT